MNAPLPRSAFTRKAKRKCVICRAAFESRGMGHKACSPDCAVEVAVRARVKKEAHARKLERKADRVKRESLKSRSDWLREAQVAFNAFIRERDKDLPCISCGRFHEGSWDAGHYRSVGAMPALRFNENNVHRQCVPCNQHRGGNIVEYRLGLIERCGVAVVEWLEMDHPPAKFTVEDAKAIKATYRAKVRELRKERHE